MKTIKILFFSVHLSLLATKSTLPQTVSSSNKIIPSKMVSGKQEIQINSSLPLKGEISILGNQIFDGMSLYFNKMKTEKNKNTFFYSLNVLDDEATIKKTRENVRILMKKSPLFINLLGTQTLEWLMKFITHGQILALFPLDGATTHRKPEYKNILFFQASFEQEIAALVDYSINTLNKKKIAIFYEDSDWGDGVVKDCKIILKKYGLLPVAEASYPQRTLNISRAVNDIAVKAPNAILCFAGARPAYNFIRDIINKGLHNTVVLGPSTLIPIQGTLKKSRGIQIITSSVVPDPERSNLAIVKEFRADLKKYMPNKIPNPFMLNGYKNAALLVEVTKGIPMPLTMAILSQRIEQLKNISFKGLELHFNEKTRSLSNEVWLNTGENKEWVRQKTEQKYVALTQKSGSKS